MVIEAGINHGFKIGDIIFLAYTYLPTVALYSNAVSVTDNRIDGKWEIIARGRAIHF